MTQIDPVLVEKKIKKDFEVFFKTKIQNSGFGEVVINPDKLDLKIKKMSVDEVKSKLGIKTPQSKHYSVMIEAYYRVY